MITGNEPAFPMDFSREGYKMNEGLTIRQQFAMAAMQGILTTLSGSYDIKRDTAEALAKEATICADALIAELNKPTT